MKVISIGTADFEKIRDNNAIYVDKTEYFWNLICNKSNSQYFLTRPRRFGKSLTVSTLKAIFQGKKDLFDGLAISSHEYNWEKYPIIHLSFGDYASTNTTVELTQEYIIKKLTEIARKNSICLDGTNSNPRDFFVDLILKMSENKNVVVLIDEYDKIITDNIEKEDLSAYRGILADFYSVLKEYESNIRFLFMTGITKFSQVSLFSKLNNLNDISSEHNFATMLGYTQDELDLYFSDYLKLAAQRHNIGVEEMNGEIRKWYDGFLFEEDSERVYNPVSIGKFFSKGYNFDNYWYDTGTPTLLMKVMETNKSLLEDSLQKPVSSMDFGTFDIEAVSTTALLFQSGYLTIDHAENSYLGKQYYLRFPNLEVKSAFTEFILKYYNTNVHPRNYANDAVKAAYDGDVNGIVNALNEYFAQFPYDICLKHEKYYQSMFFAFFTLCQVAIETECHTYRGRIDAVVVAGKNCYICEFKLDKSAAVAMKQIEQQDYCRKYLNRGLNVIKVAANFDSETGMISDVQSESVS